MSDLPLLAGEGDEGVGADTQELYIPTRIEKTLSGNVVIEYINSRIVKVEIKKGWTMKELQHLIDISTNLNTCECVILHFENSNAVSKELSSIRNVLVELKQLENQTIYLVLGENMNQLNYIKEFFDFFKIENLRFVSSKEDAISDINNPIEH